MGRFVRTTTTTTPLFVQSKLLCLSLLYLFTTLFLFLYVSFSRNQCVFRSSPFDPIQKPLFSYPSSYGEHKYAIPTHRSSCSSPVFFSDYWKVLDEIQNLCRNTSYSENLLYMKGKSEHFAGNFNTQKRFSYFDHSNHEVEVPCGFFRDVPISDSDRTEMENCRGVVVASAIFNDHDKIRQPVGLGSKTLENVCFYMFIDDKTLNSFYHHNLIPRNNPMDYKIGVWRIIKIQRGNKLYANPAMNGVIPKYLVHRLFPNSKFSIWVDAKIQLMVDPLLLIHSFLIVPDDQEVDMAIPKHPFFVNTMEEAMATARWKKWEDVDGLRRQMEAYCELGLKPWSPHKLPYPTDVPDSAMILRRHGVRSNMFSCLMFNELEAFNPRDQLAFAFVRDLMNPKIKINMFEVEVFEQIAVEFRHNLKKIETHVEPQQQRQQQRQGQRRREEKKTRRWKNLLSWSLNASSCKDYLLEMWG